MRIAIIGAGNVGGALATTFRGVGHDVVLGVRDPGVGIVSGDDHRRKALEKMVKVWLALSAKHGRRVAYSVSLG